MNSIRFYQPPKASLRRDGRDTASNFNVPKASGDCDNYDLIKILDVTGLPPKESHDPIRAPALDLCTEADASDTSNGLNITRGYGRSGVEEDSDFPPVEELLFNIGNAQERQRTGSSDGHVTGGSEGNPEHTAEGDRNSAASPRSSEGEHKEKPVAVGDSRAEDRNTQDAQRKAGGSIGVYASDDLTAEGDEEREAVCPDESIVPYDMDSNDSDAYAALRNKSTPIFRYPSILRPKGRNNRASSTRDNPGSPGDPIVGENDDTDSDGDGTSPTSGGGSVARYLNLHKKGERDTPNTSPPYRNTLSSTPGKQTCGSEGGNRKGLRPDPSTGRDKKNPWNGKETEADNKKEDQERHNKDGDKETTPSLGPIEKKRPSAVGGKSASKRRVSSQDDITAQAEEWEIVKIRGKRRTVSGTQYLVGWKSTWLPEGELGNAQELLLEFKANGQARHRRKRVGLAHMDKVW